MGYRRCKLARRGSCGHLGAALAGAVTARILTWIAERKRNRDAYRAPQREAIGAIIAAANDMKVSLSDALEHMGLTGRQTTDDAAVQSLNTFLRRLDEEFTGVLFLQTAEMTSESGWLPLPSVMTLSLRLGWMIHRAADGVEDRYAAGTQDARCGPVATNVDQRDNVRS